MLAAASSRGNWSSLWASELKYSSGVGAFKFNSMEEDGLLENAARVGAHLQAGLARELGGLAGVTEIRGQGLMLGIELAKPCGVLTQRAAEKGLLISVTADNVIRLVPPLILTEADADEIVALLAPLVREFLSE